MKKFIVFFAAIAMVGAFAFSAVAADWSFYGSSRVSTISYDKSKEMTTAGTYDDQDTTWTSQQNTRFGAKIDAGDVTGRIEQSYSANSFGIRLMYGEWNFGAGKLLVGQDYTPTDQILGASVGVLPSLILPTGVAPVDGEGSALGVGSFYNSRRTQIKLKFGSFQLAFIQPYTTASSGGPATEVDTTMPALAASYKFATDMFSITPYGGWNSFDEINATDQDYSVESTVYGLAFTVNMGPAYVKGNVWGGQNVENMGRAGDVTLYDVAWWNGTGYDDSDQVGGQLIAGFKLSDMLTFEGGYSMDQSEVTSGGVKYESDPTHFYVCAVITLAPGVYITPEFGKYDLGDNKVGAATTKRGDVSYFGAQWKINF